MMSLKRSVMALVACVSIAMTGCSSSSSNSSDKANRTAMVDMKNLPPVTSDYSWPAPKTPKGYYPITVKSCGKDVTFTEAPKRAVVNDDNMVEMMFALGLTDHMAAYSAAKPRLRLQVFKDDYEKVKSLGTSYFKLEPVMAENPDFVFSGWNYGFSPDGINPDSLAALGVKSYVLNESCRRINQSMEPATIEEWFDDMRNLGAIFGVPERAEALIQHWKKRLETVEKNLPKSLTPVRAFNYGFGTDEPGGGLGLTIVSELFRKSGAVNVFEDLKKMWGRVSWEAFVDSKPEIIVVTDYGAAGAGQTGEEKIKFLKSQKGVDTVPAVKNDRFFILPQEAVNPGIRIFDGIEALAAYLYPNEFKELVKTPGFGLASTYDAQ